MRDSAPLRGSPAVLRPRQGFGSIRGGSRASFCRQNVDAMGASSLRRAPLASLPSAASELHGSPLGFPVWFAAPFEQPHSTASAQWLFALTIIAAVASSTAHAADATMPTPAVASFLRTHCVECHQGDEAEAGLDLVKLGYDLATPIQAPLDSHLRSGTRRRNAAGRFAETESRRNHGLPRVDRRLAPHVSPPARCRKSAASAHDD